MKKLVLLLAVTLPLTACASKTNSSPSSSSVAITQTSSYKRELAKALYSPDAVFPQLDSNVNKDEAEVVISTSMGDITVKLFPTIAPLACQNFLTHAKNGYYNGLTWHRVINDFMIQSGDPRGDGTGGQSIWKGKDSSIDPGDGFANEPSPYLYNIRGALAMANSGADTNGSQFFIVENKEDQSNNLSLGQYPQKIIDAYKQGGSPTLDGNYTVFGQVISGMEVVDAIAAVPTYSQEDQQADNKHIKDMPKEEVLINSITVTKDYSFK